ncbi:MAG: glycosyltransferase family A protein [Verrucomicrobia bacterium]|nr:glycosyltransferase family A protein [Verrucomicrobiota bacterium]
MNNAHPLVSVCIPVYNGEAFLEETLQSLLAQTYPNWELIVVDEASEDRTREIVEGFRKRNPAACVKLYVNETRLRQARNMNRAIELARGEFIKVLCADDLIEPDCLALQVAALQKHPTAVLAGSSKKVIDAKGRYLFTAKRLPDGFLPGRKAIEACFRAGTNLIGEPSLVLLRASALKGFPLMNIEVPNCTDLDLWLRLLVGGDMVFSGKPLGSFRVQGQSGTRASGIPLSRSVRAWLAVWMPVQNTLRRWIYRLFA